MGIHRPDGTLRWISVNADPIPGSDERSTSVVTSFADVTQRKLAEETLRVSEERHRLLAENARDVVWTMEPDGSISYVSPAVEVVRGFTPAEAMSQSLEEILTPASQNVSRTYFVGLLADIQEGRTPKAFRGEEEYLCKDGSTFWTEVIAFPLLNADGTLHQLLGVTRDIAERKRAEEEIRRLNAELEQRVRERTAKLEGTNRELESFSYTVSHDLRSPLRAVSGYSRLLERHLGRTLDDEGRRLLRNIADNGSLMGSLVDGLLDFVRTRNAEPERSPVDMKRTAEQVARELLSDPTHGHVEIRISSLPPTYADHGLVSAVLRHLLTNAVHFSAGKPTPVVEVGFEAGPDGPVYFVKDNGVGFDPKYASKLFGVFHRLEGAPELGRTGIGLAMVKRIVERHGGWVRAEGTLGEGAAFYFTLGPARAEPEVAPTA